jgi:aspartate aminotransferase
MMAGEQIGKTGFTESTYVAGMEASSTMAVTAEVERLRSQGIEVIDLGAGEPDFPTPENVKNAARRAIEENFTRYTPAGGIAALKRAVVEMLEREFRASYEPSQAIVTVGAKQGIFNAMAALLNPGDQVLIASPYWVTFPEIAKFLQAEPVFIDTEENEFLLTAEMVRAAITPRTRLLILNSPNNPTGRVIPPDEVRKIVEAASDRGVWVISDECYLHFAYPPAVRFTAGQLPGELRARLLVCGSFSKSYAMTGWRVGFALGPEPWIRAMLKIQSHSTSNVTSISQKAAVEAALGEQDSLKAMLDEYKHRRDWLIPALNEIAGVSCAMPEGAFYAFPNVGGLLRGEIRTSADLARFLLERAHVAVTAGSAFGAEGYLRISYANSLEAIQTAVDNIKTALASIQ